MKRRLTGIFAALVLAGGAAAQAAAAAPEMRIEPMAPTLDELERVDSIVMLRGPHSWRAVDGDTLILWATPFDPYLIELAYPSNDLQFAHAIGLRQTGARLHAKFDRVYVEGFPYRIDGIYKLSRDEAKAFGRTVS